MIPQVLKVDNFGSVDHLARSSNEETVACVKDLILKKLRNQMNHMTKTDTKLKHGVIDGERGSLCILLIIMYTIHLDAINAQRSKPSL